MLKPATHIDPIVELISTTIADRLRPRRIVLFGSRARGDAKPHSDYDVMVEVESDLSGTDLIHEIVSVLRNRDWDLNVVITRPGDLEERCDDPGAVYWDIAREGVLLYSADGAYAWPPVPRPRQVREPNAPHGSLEEWIRLAEEDLLNVDICVTASRVPWSTVGFHAQQAAEKYLTALLVHKNVRPPRVHEIHVLVDRLREAGVDLPDVAAECKALNVYAVQARYPLWPEAAVLGEATARAAVKASRRIVALAKELLGRP